MADSRDRLLKDRAERLATTLDGARGDSLPVKIGGDELTLTSLDKVMVTAEAEGQAQLLTKRRMLQYYATIAPILLPKLINRPLTLKRYPDGFTGKSFMQRHLDEAPEFLHTVEMFSDSANTNKRFLLSQNLASLLWLANLDTVEFHPWYSTIDPANTKLPTIFINSTGTLELSVANYPDQLIFDLDPPLNEADQAVKTLDLESDGCHAAFDRAREAAFGLKRNLDERGLASFVKTTGKTGLHVVVPLVRQYPYEQAREAAKRIGESLISGENDLLTMEWQIPKRQGKVFFDYTQNARGKSVAAAYSIRATLQASISMPLEWSELERAYPEEFTVRQFVPLDGQVESELSNIVGQTASGEPIEAAYPVPKTPFEQRVAAQLAGRSTKPMERVRVFKDAWKDLFKYPQTLPQNLLD